jgi:hypothetical protein
MGPGLPVRAPFSLIATRNPEATMACIDSTGTLTITAKFLIKELGKNPLPPPEIAKALGEPVFRVRGNLRELAEAGFIREEDGVYHLTDQGREHL